MLVVTLPVQAAPNAPAQVIAKSPAIPLDQLGAVVGKQYSGDGLAVSATPQGAHLRCVFQKLEGEATSRGLWLTSTVTNAAPERFRVKAVAVGREQPLAGGAQNACAEGTFDNSPAFQFQRWDPCGQAPSREATAELAPRFGRPFGTPSVTRPNPTIAKSPSRTEERNREARCSFEALGAKAQSSVPALIEIADRDISHTSQYCVIDALAFVGQPAKEAIPSLLRWATNADYEVRYCAIRALGTIGAEADRVLPVLIKALPDPSSLVRMGAVWSLTDFEQNSKLAVPAPVEFLNTPSDSMSDRSYATNALRKIDPEAAAIAGVK